MPRTTSSTLFFLLFASVLLNGCGMWGKAPDPTKGWSARQLYLAAKERLDERDYETALDYYGKLESRYPFGALAEQAQLETAYAYYKRDERASAIAAVDRFLKQHPWHPHADYAYYLRGLASFNPGRNFLDRFVPRDLSERDPGSALHSFRDFEELVRRFPDSRYAGDAAQRMIFLKNTLAEHEMHVAGYYMRRRAYVAAANRAKYVVEHYQGTPAMPHALALMAGAYRKLSLDDLADDALRVLKLNYPEYSDGSQLEAR